MNLKTDYYNGNHNITAISLPIIIKEPTVMQIRMAFLLKSEKELLTSDINYRMVFQYCNNMTANESSWGWKTVSTIDIDLKHFITQEIKLSKSYKIILNLRDNVMYYKLVKYWIGYGTVNSGSYIVEQGIFIKKFEYILLKTHSKLLLEDQKIKDNYG